VKQEDRLIEDETKTSHQEEIKIFSKKIGHSSPGRHRFIFALKIIFAKEN